MAAHFGLWEVNFPSSRAVDFDDDDDEEDTERQAEPLFFEWSPSMQKELGDSSSFNCSLLIVGVDEVASTFLEAHYLTAPNDTVGLLTARKVEGDFATTAKSSHVNKGGVLHRLTENPSVVVCLVNGHVPQEKAFSWTEKLFENVKSFQVVVLTSSPSAQYHTTNPWSLTADFVRMLKTDLWQTKFPTDICRFLETPNTVRGLPAAVLSHCQIFRVPAALYVCYTESAYIDSRSVNAFKFLLTAAPFNSIQQGPSEEITKILNSAGHGKLAGSNLYL